MADNEQPSATQVVGSAVFFGLSSLQLAAIVLTGYLIFRPGSGMRSMSRRKKKK